MARPAIETPRGKIITGSFGEVKIEWNPNFRAKHQSDYSRAQSYVDEQVLKRSAPYTPLRTSVLMNSGTLGTEVGSGLVQWIAPYSRKQYYSTRAPGSQTGPLRGPRWFERMKEVDGASIIRGARRIAGGGRK